MAAQQMKPAVKPGLLIFGLAVTAAVISLSTAGMMGRGSLFERYCPLQLPEAASPYAAQLRKYTPTGDSGQDRRYVGSQGLAAASQAIPRGEGEAPPLPPWDYGARQLRATHYFSTGNPLDFWERLELSHLQQGEGGGAACSQSLAASTRLAATCLLVIAVGERQQGHGLCSRQHGGRPFKSYIMHDALALATLHPPVKARDTLARQSAGHNTAPHTHPIPPAELRQIQLDGFDAIIIVIPWGGFQVSVDPVLYDPWLYSRLHAVLAAARAAGIYVVARIGGCSEIGVCTWVGGPG